MADDPLQNISSSQTDTSKIRTYAKDVARMTGKPLLQGSIPQTAPTVKPPPSERLAPLEKETRKPDPTASREAVLARLKAKAKEQETKAPLPPAPVPQPAVSTANTPAPLHTYQSDYATYSKKKGATPISVVAAEQNAYNKRAPEVLTQKKPRWWLPYVGGTGFILAGVVAIVSAVYFSQRPTVPPDPFVPALIFADERKQITGDGETLQEELSRLSEVELREGGVVVAYVAYASTTPEGKTVMEPVSGNALVRALDLGAPDIVLRNVEDSSTVGAVRAGNTYPFFILRVSSYERTFAGMLSWEDEMQEDLSRLYPPFPAPVASTTATSTATTTPAAPVFTFFDRIVANHDVRVLKDEEGRTILLYGYKDKETLVIARNERAFTELLTRLSATRF